MVEDTPLWLVQDAEMLQEVAERLTRAGVIGVDTESDSFYHYQEKVCLIQFSDLDTDYIVDPLAIEDMSPLAQVFADRPAPVIRLAGRQIIGKTPDQILRAAG